MRTIVPLQADPSARPSFLERLIQQLYRVRIPPLLIIMSLAMGLAAMAGRQAVKVSRDYYAIAPYHYDSASYRMQAVRLHETLKSKGMAHALRQSLQAKDSVDMTLRLILAPRFLLHPYGHLVVLLPFMSVFILLAGWYVFTRTNSLLLSIATFALLFAFPFIYDPYMGIADYWKDNLATWLLGSAAVAWLLSNMLAERRWAFLCSLFLGLLVMQRTAAAVYAGMLFLPLFLWAIYQRLRLDGPRQALARIGVFVAPATLLSGLLAVIQWQQLYKYYFVVGYAYGTPALIAQYLAHPIHELGLPPIVVVAVICVMYLLYLISGSSRKQQRDEIIVASWLVVGLPLVVILSSGFYFGFYAVWPVLLIVLLATLIPRSLSITNSRLFALVLLIVASASSVFQYHISVAKGRLLAESRVGQRKLHQDVANIIAAQPEPRSYGLFFDEDEGPFFNHVFFDHGILLPPPAGYMSVHDTYYRAEFGDLTAQEIIDLNIRNLEQQAGAIAVAFCEPKDILKQPLFLSDRQLFSSDEQPLAIPVAIALNDYLLQSPRWRAISRLNSPFGCLYAYKYSAQTLTETEKWQDLAFHKSLTEIPLTFSLAPGVRIYDYRSRYQPEQVNGIYQQWLPSGVGGLRLTLFSDRARAVALQARAAIGPAGKDAIQTLVMANGQTETSLPLSSEQEIHIKLELHPGLNNIDVYVKEPTDNLATQNSASARELMLLLVSPRIVESPS